MNFTLIVQVHLGAYEVPKPIALQNVKETGNIRIQSSISMYAIIVGQSLKTNQRVGITVAAGAIFETGSGEMKM